MTKQFRFRGVTKHDAKCRNSQLDLIKYAQASHIIFKIIWYQEKKEIGLFNIRLSKLQNENHMQSNESVSDNADHCHETDKIVVCTARASFSITFNSLSLRTRPNSENNQLDLMSVLLTLFFLGPFFSKTLSILGPFFSKTQSNVFEINFRS